MCRFRAKRPPKKGIEGFPTTQTRVPSKHTHRECKLSVRNDAAAAHLRDGGCVQARRAMLFSCLLGGERRESEQFPKLRGACFGMGKRKLESKTTRKPKGDVFLKTRGRPKGQGLGGSSSLSSSISTHTTQIGPLWSRKGLSNVRR